MSCKFHFYLTYVFLSFQFANVSATGESIILGCFLVVFSNLFVFDAVSKKCGFFSGVSGSLGPFSPKYDPILLKF